MAQPVNNSAKKVYQFHSFFIHRKLSAVHIGGLLFQSVKCNRMIEENDFF